eukprot:scaffold61382_cov14-Tisochrysis_lutea.AAC.2
MITDTSIPLLPSTDRGSVSASAMMVPGGATTCSSRIMRRLMLASAQAKEPIRNEPEYAFYRMLASAQALEY